jgi:APA family basic amino acid/polyamine antiporter
LAQQQLQRLLGRGFSAAACVGATIGLGILRTPGEIARAVDSPAVYLALWLGGGLFVLLSTLMVAELIGMTPRSGGPYVLIARAYGPFPGFLLGWTDWLSQCAAGALKAVVLMEYLSLLLPGLAPWVTAGAVLVNSLFALFQLGGVRLTGGFLQFSAAVFGLILLAVAAALVFGPDAAAPEAAANAVRADASWAQWGIVAAAVVFTYDGWIAASYYGAEVRGGGRAAALGSLRGVVLVIALYLLLNGALAFSVPLEVLVGHELALAGALDWLYGPGVGVWLTLAALFILAAHQNMQYMACARTLYALSVDGLGARRATAVHARGNPTGAVLASWAMMVTLILAGGFEFLLNLSALLFMALYLALMVGVFRMRRVAPAAERPFRAWGFPVTGMVCVAGWLAVAIFVGLMDPASAAWSVVLAALALPVYRWLAQRRGLQAAA